MGKREDENASLRDVVITKARAYALLPRVNKDETCKRAGQPELRKRWRIKDVGIFL